MKRLLSSLAGLLILLSSPAQAWWDDAWSHRSKITLNTSAAGAQTQQALDEVPVLLRLHPGNFAFLDAREDGADLRLVAGDDKTPVKFRIERWDGLGQMAVLWLKLPKLLPGTDQGFVWLYYGNAGAVAEPPAPDVFDSRHAAVLHFALQDAAPKDATANGNNAAGPIDLEAAGLSGAAASLKGTPLVLPASPSLKLDPAAGFTYSAWIKTADPAKGGTLYAQQAGKAGVALALEGGKLAARVDAAKPVTGGEIKPNTWQHVALTVGGGKATLFLDGQQVAQGDANLPAVQAEVRIGGGYAGLLDEVQISSVARSEDWLRVAAASQGVDARLVLVAPEAEGAEEEGSHSYFGVLVGNLTTDAWVVIIILMVMFVVAVWVMVGKASFINRVDRDNRVFLQRFRSAAGDILNLGDGAAPTGSSLFRLYQAGVREMAKRIGATPGKQAALSGASLDAIKASIDADMVRETHRLNSQMVLLTIAISGGPFLGLLGTVVGVMITFAAIAAAGDVNVNAIAPGIAAALLATVAGLAVAIPALFGYNYLASRIKNISADMQIFVDEFVTRVAETYGAK